MFEYQQRFADVLVGRNVREVPLLLLFVGMYTWVLVDMKKLREVVPVSYIASP